MTERIILSLPGDTNLIELAWALASIDLGVSSIAGIDGEVVVGKLNPRPFEYQTSSTQSCATQVSHEQ